MAESTRVYLNCKNSQTTNKDLIQTVDMGLYPCNQEITVTCPSINGYTPDSSTVTFDTNADASIYHDAFYSPKQVSITVICVDETDSANEKEIERYPYGTVTIGTTISIVHSITNYTQIYNPYSYKVESTEDTQTVQVGYYKNSSAIQVTVVVQEYNAQGTLMGTYVVGDYAQGSDITIFAPQIYGYSPAVPYQNIKVGNNGSNMFYVQFYYVVASKPTPFTFKTDLNSGKTLSTYRNINYLYIYILPCEEWTNLQQNVNLFRKYKQKTDWTFSTIIKDMDFSAVYINEVVNAINDMNPSSVAIIAEQNNTNIPTVLKSIETALASIS